MRLLLALLLLPLPLSAWAQTLSSPQELTDRRERDRALAALVSADTVSTAVAADAEILTSLGITPAQSPSLTRTGAAAAFGVFSNLGAAVPIVSSQFLAISTGMAGSTAPQPGTDFAPSGVSGDRATLAVTFTVPQGVTRLTFLYRFMSAEYPEYVGSQFNDLLSISAVRNGVRQEVSRSSVNSALFEGASTANAGGSGYETYISANPTGGLTRWIPVSVPVTPGMPVTLEFSIEDFGDGIYDSQVLVSRLGLASIETVDPNPALFDGLNLTTDINRLAAGGRPVRGATTDGATRVLLRAVPTDATSVRFSVVGSQADGGLTPRSGGTPQPSVTVDVVGTASGPRAYALYFPPEEFGSPTAAERAIVIRATYLGGAAESAEDLSFALARPPILLIHGIWSSFNEAWGDSGLLSDPRFMDRIEPFSYPNNAAMSTNYPRYRGWVNSMLTKFRSSGLAATRVDVIGHSMGGILARLYASKSPTYKRADNFNAGDFNRVITVNTPHSGSPLANIATTAHEYPIVGGAFDSMLAKMKMPYGLAVENMREGSSTLQDIARVDVRGHVLAGTGGSDLVEAAGAVGTIADLLAHIQPQPPLTTGILKALSFVADSIEAVNTVIFGNRQHDIVVPLDSQLGGMPGPRTTPPFGGWSSLHITATSSALYTAELASLLNTAPSLPMFGSFPARGGNPSLTMLEDLPAVTNVAPPVGLSVSVSPTSAVPGGTVRVTVTPLGGFTAAAVIVTGPGVAAIDQAAPFVVDLTIPTTHIGPFAIGAVGRQNDGTFVESNTVTVQVTTLATLTSIEVRPGLLLLAAIDATAALEVTGPYSDNVTRVLNGSGLVAFSSTNPGVATVDATGVVTARGLGYATISATAGGRQASVSVTVNPFADQPPPRADAGPDRGVTPGTPVTLIGAALAVPAGLTPTFSWSQVSGLAPLALSSTSAATTSFTPTVAGVYLLSLVVRAGLAESEPDNITVVVGAAAGPVVSIPPSSLVVRQGETASFSVVATGIPTPTFLWRKDGAPVAGGSAPTLTIPAAQSADAGAYTVDINNPSGSATAGPAQLTVCSYVLSSATVSFEGAGGFASVMVSTADACSWSATSDAGWLTVTSGASGTGNGSISFTAAASTSPGPRTASLAIGGQIVTVNQAAGVNILQPGAPENLVASQQGTTVTLIWDAPTVGQPPTGYVVELGTRPGGNELPPRPTGNTATTHTFTMSSGAYYVRVRGVNANGQGEPSNEARISFGGAVAPPASPSDLSAVVEGSSVTLRWLPSASGNTPTAYVLEAGSALTQANILTLDTGSSQPTLSTVGVPPGHYFLRVRGRNAAGTGAASNELALRVGPAVCVAAPGAPALLSPSVRGNALGVSWLPPSSGAASSYVLLAGTIPGNANLGTLDTGSASTSFNVPVGPGTYYVRVVARSSCGDSAPSNEVSFTVGGTTSPPGRPTGLTVSMGAGGIVTFNWFPPATGGPPSSYVLQAGTASGLSDLATVPTGLTATTFSAAGVPPGQYYVRVVAVNAAGSSSASNEVVLTVQ